MNITIDTKFDFWGEAYIQGIEEGTQKWLTASAEMLRDKARDLLISNGSVKSGRLRDSIRATKSRDKSKTVAYVFAGNRSEDIYWAHFIEYGTYWKPAKPFMRPTMDRNFSAIKEDARRQARGVINQQRRDKKTRTTSTKTKPEDRFI